MPLPCQCNFEFSYKQVGFLCGRGESPQTPGRAEKARAARARYLHPVAADPAMEATIDPAAAAATATTTQRPILSIVKQPVLVGSGRGEGEGEQQERLLTDEMRESRAEARKQAEEVRYMKHRRLVDK